jgi:hypothetical protein
MYLYETLFPWCQLGQKFFKLTSSCMVLCCEKLEAENLLKLSIEGSVTRDFVKTFWHFFFI